MAPLWRRAKNQLKSAVRAPPTCRYPVGEGAKRTRTAAFELPLCSDILFARSFVVLVIFQSKGSLEDRPILPCECRSTGPAITYATGTLVRLHSQKILSHNRKYFVLCR